MNEDALKRLLLSGNLRVRQPDFGKVKSMLSASETNAKVVQSISPTEESATVIFREIYESVRQLGEAKWWLLGYEPQGLGSHSVALDILKDIDIKEKLKLNSLERFKKIRHDANYRGMQVTLSQANEMLEFWDKCGKEILALLKKETEPKQSKNGKKVEEGSTKSHNSGR